ncbi:hypothetical protein AAT19DRAFT_13807 [Rhodotorula toruloides]|uniref:Uncharacterized protein n=1 Tax=Rhodotorula toruloides TaxID=5286 RepID=A0A2T0A9U8_RHOTO|nr:hypothetical protein AAT19DRAFT_13807 [Rhodotorula toruloides]
MRVALGTALGSMKPRTSTTPAGCLQRLTLNMPSTLISPTKLRSGGVETSTQDRLHLTLPALPIRVVLARDWEGRSQWALAQRDINVPADIREIAGPAFLKAQHALPKSASCAYASSGLGPRLIKGGITVRLSSGTGRKDIQVCLWQDNAEGYQRAGLTHLSAVAPRKVVFDLTLEHRALNPRPTLHFRLTFDLDYGQPGHAGAVTAHEIVARSLGERAPRVLRRW